MIEVQDLSKKYPTRGQDIIALRDLTVSWAPGKIHGVVGLNGAGKTTLLRVLSGFSRPSRGSVTVLGIDVVKHPGEAIRLIGFVSMNTRPYDRLTVLEILVFFGRITQLPERDIHGTAEALIARFGLDEHRNTICGRLSNGSRQKVSVARALIHRPKVLLLDEPSNGLDVPSARELRSLIKACCKPETHIVIATNNPLEADELFDTILVLNQGRAVSNGEMDSIRRAAPNRKFEDVLVDLMKQRSNDLQRSPRRCVLTAGRLPANRDLRIV
jgi:ABC-type multidrug transport system ATPase subunit